MVPTNQVVGTTLATQGIARASRKGCPNHPIDFKRRLGALACVPGISVAKLAAKHGVNANLLFKWRRHYRAGKFGALVPEDAAVAAATRAASAKLLPVLASAPVADRPLDVDVSQSQIEIILAAATVRVRGEVSSATLRTILDCLAHRP